MEGETAQYAEYNPQSNIRSETEIDKRLGGTLIAVGLGVAAAGFAGRYAFQLWKRLGQVLSQGKKMPTSSFSSHHYNGGFDQKMTKKEASLILGISPTSTNSKVRNAHRRIMVLNHPG
ncbi:dnaJ homolog subfamily C member 15-like [Oncorhynchus keta]|uniref:dnaJ homolog subfamily C member 15-like n=1 Tax=Oncorhynchus keta TaxID=8018 RepID=UPI0015F8AAD1|nr:dnaJ homolog subfamily C member 15-like [Oncorhynchus keta]